MALPLLHLLNKLASSLPNLQLFLLLATFFHLFYAFLVSGLLVLALSPLFVSDFCHDFQVIFIFLDFLILHLLLLLNHALGDQLLSLLDQGHFEPLLKCVVGALFLRHFLKSFLLPLSHLTLLF